MGKTMHAWVLASACCALWLLAGACGALQPASSTATAATGASAADANGADDTSASTRADGGNGATGASSTTVTGNVVFNGNNLAAFAGQVVQAVVVTQGGRVVGQASAPVANDTVSLNFAVHATDGAGNLVAYYIDRNNNGFCNVTPIDAGGNALIGADGTASATYVAGAAVPCAAMGSWDVAVRGLYFSDGNDHNVVVALADQQDGTYVAGPLVAPVVTDTWNAYFPNVAVDGHSYVVRYWLDSQDTGVCQDNGWALAFASVHANVSATVQPSASKSSVCTAFPTR